jgi:hypothetical protein
MVIQAESFLEKAASDIERDWDVLIKEIIDCGDKKIIFDYEPEIDKAVLEEVTARYRMAGFEIKQYPSPNISSRLYTAKVIQKGL